MGVINPFVRYQVGFTLHNMFPAVPGICACGCSRAIAGRKKKWHSKECRDRAYTEFAIVKGDTVVVRAALYEIDKGACRECGNITDDWEADHIMPVHAGGGGCDISNYQTLCKVCHLDKTLKQYL